MTDNIGAGVYQSLRSLLQLVIGELDLEVYIEKEVQPESEIDNKRLNELTDESRIHEKSHAEAWMRYGIKSHFVLDQGNAGTIPDKDSLLAYIKKNNLDVESFRKIFLEVVMAPITPGNTDSWMARILRKEFKTLSEFAQVFGAAQQ